MSCNLLLSRSLREAMKPKISSNITSRWVHKEIQEKPICAYIILLKPSRKFGRIRQYFYTAALGSGSDKLSNSPKLHLAFASRHICARVPFSCLVLPWCSPVGSLDFQWSSLLLQPLYPFLEEACEVSSLPKYKTMKTVKSQEPALWMGC